MFCPNRLSSYRLCETPHRTRARDVTLPHKYSSDDMSSVHSLHETPRMKPTQQDDEHDDDADAPCRVMSAVWSEALSGPAVDKETLKTPGGSTDQRRCPQGRRCSSPSRVFEAHRATAKGSEREGRIGSFRRFHRNTPSIVPRSVFCLGALCCCSRDQPRLSPSLVRWRGLL